MSNERELALEAARRIIGGNAKILDAIKVARALLASSPPPSDECKARIAINAALRAKGSPFAP